MLNTGNFKHIRICFCIINFSLLVFFLPGYAQTSSTLSYKVEASALVSNGDFAPFWFTANRYGALSNENNQALLRTGLCYTHKMKHHWMVETGLELNGGANLVSSFVIQQAYADLKWKEITLSVGAKEHTGGPLDKNRLLSGGWMVEGPNARPIPQVRGEINEYLAVPGTRNWLAFKGHLAYGWFTDGDWQENFVGVNQSFTKKVLYHSKSLMLRFGNKEKFPIDFEIGMITAAQFGGKKYRKEADGTIKLESNFPGGIKQFFEVFIPRQKNTLSNVSGNHCGSWNFALNMYPGDWKIRSYYEHFFEDHSQMFWQYGRWKDGLLGCEMSLPSNCWVSDVLWECMSTKDQTGAVLYDGVGGSYPDIQMSGNDHYYNNYEYLGWQHYGASLGHPFLYGPLYNDDHSNYIKSTRVRSHHLGVSGNPTSEFNWRMLLSFVRHWGTYRIPLERQKKQFSGLMEVTYSPKWMKGWSSSLAIGVDRGNYLGNHFGGMLTLRKLGGFSL